MPPVCVVYETGVHPFVDEPCSLCNCAPLPFMVHSWPVDSSVNVWYRHGGELTICMITLLPWMDTPKPFFINPPQSNTVLPAKLPLHDPVLTLLLTPAVFVPSDDSAAFSSTHVWCPHFAGCSGLQTYTGFKSTPHLCKPLPLASSPEVPDYPPRFS